MSREVDNIDKYTEPEVENDHQQPVKRFSEHIVVLTIVVLSFLNALTDMMIVTKLLNSESSGIQVYRFYNIASTGGSVLGAIMMAFLSDVCGRKPVFILLAAISPITSMCLVSSNKELALISLSIHAVARGGAQTVFYLTVTEYGNPKHRFTYVVACLSMASLGSVALKILNKYVLPEDSVYMQVFMIVLGLACLGSTCVWPESPYWLAARGRRGEAACSLRRMRGARVEPELSQLQHERRSPGLARLYWRSLLIVLIISTISVLNNLLDIAKFRFFDPMRAETMDNDVSILIISSATIVVLALVTIMSYFVKRKTLYISCCGVAIVLTYVIGFWICSGTTNTNPAFPFIILISDTVRSCAPRTLNVILVTELVPYKYNTHISCVRFIYMIVLQCGLQMLFFIIIDTSNYVYLLVLLVATLTVVGVVLVFWLAPETKDRTLFEIQKSQAPQYTVTCPEQNETMMQNINRLNTAE